MQRPASHCSQGGRTPVVCAAEICGIRKKFPVIRGQRTTISDCEQFGGGWRTGCSDSFEDKNFFDMWSG